MVQVEHPRVDASGNLTLVESELVVLGVHPHPFRFVSYVDANQYSLFAPVPFANSATLIPADGVAIDQLKRELFVMEGVTSIQEVGATARAIRDFLDEFVIILRVVEGAMLAIAFLIAYNASSINMDERSREHATMFAFGVRIRTVMRMAIVESFIVGVIATVGGIAGGWILLRVLLATRIEDTLPDIYIKATISPTTLVIAVALGVLVVALAPLLQWRRLTSMDVPSTLKVME
jgi:putative ABC transport system permease protein